MAKPGEAILSQLLSLLFPLRCAHCGACGEELCPSCRDRLKPIGPTSCRRCGKPSLYDVPECRECRGRRLHFGSAQAAFRYAGPARSAIHRLKYSGRRHLAAVMAEATRDHPRLAGLTEKKGEVTLTYVPVHASRKFSRGYNQAELYARALSKTLGLPLAGLLVKNFPTTPQNRLNFNDRGKNLSDSFSVRRGYGVETPKVLLVDDVYTTGATVSECSRVLTADLGVVVDVWTFARTVKN